MSNGEMCDVRCSGIQTDGGRDVEIVNRLRKVTSSLELVSGCQAGGKLRREIKAAVVHVQRFQNILRDVMVERLPGNLLRDVTCERDAITRVAVDFPRRHYDGR